MSSLPLRAAAAAVAALALALPSLARAADTPPSFANHAGPADLVGDAGEPSIGYNPATDQVLFQANTTTARVDFTTSTPTWTDVTEPTAVTSLDPILFTDRQTGRTFSSQLMLACSKMALSDDDGASWTPSQGCGIGTAFDHQTVGGGPYHAGAIPPAHSQYPNAVYYCAQADLTATCARSDTGGQTFGEAHPLYTAAQCAGLHGHVKVAPDGTAYVPNFDCADANGDSRQAAVTSTDNGTTWTPDTIPDSTTQDKSDPHIGIGDKGTVYFGYQGARGQDVSTSSYTSYSEGPAMVAVKRAGSGTWGRSVDVGAALGIKNIEFPEVFAGDDDRAAFAFLGTTTAGDDQSPDFKGVWHLYVAYTYDQGQTWTTVDATPNDPVQRGCIWLQGGSSACRNLLDFNDITIDRAGRVLVAYADGCTGSCVTDPNDYTTKTSLGTIARQSAGKGLLAAYDATTTGTTTGATTSAGGASTASDGPTATARAASASSSEQPVGGPLAVASYQAAPTPAREGAEAQKAECRREDGFRSVSVRVLRSGGLALGFRRAARGAVTIDVLRLAGGRRPSSQRVARFGGRTRGLTFRGLARRGAPGRFAITFSVPVAEGRRDVRQVVVTRTAGGLRIGRAQRVAPACERD